MPARIRCPYCDRVGFVRVERIIRGTREQTQYYCGSCNQGWRREGSNGEDERTREAVIKPEPSRWGGP